MKIDLMKVFVKSLFYFYNRREEFRRNTMFLWTLTWPTQAHNSTTSRVSIPETGSERAEVLVIGRNILSIIECGPVFHHLRKTHLNYLLTSIYWTLILLIYWVLRVTTWVPSVSGFDRLLRLPTGCGEQTIASSAPDGYVYKYLEIIEQLTEQMKDQTLGFMERGNLEMIYILSIHLMKQLK